MPWSPEHPGGPFLTLVARLPEVAAELTGFREELRRIAPHDHHYQPDQLHVTILNLDATRGLSPGVLHDTLCDVLRDASAFEVTFHGAGVSPHSVYLAGDGTARLATLRRELRHRFSMTAPDDEAGDELAFCNLMRFAQARPYRRLARWLRTTTPTARGTPVHAELVETDKALSAARTRVLARFTLAA